MLRSVPLSAILAVVGLGAAASAASAAEGVTALQGAWVEQSATCDAVFSSKSTGASFRKPSNIFAPGFIVTGKQLRTPQSSCRIKAVQAAGDRSRLILDCATSVAVSEFRVLVAFTGDGKLRRFFSDDDKAGSPYSRCGG